MKLRTVGIVGVVLMAIAVVGEVLAAWTDLGLPWVPFVAVQTVAFVFVIYYAVVAKQQQQARRRQSATPR